MDHKQWEDIGYNFLVGEDGNVYEGRGWGVKGAHSIPYNGKSMGICMIGNFESKFEARSRDNQVEPLTRREIMILKR